ncbi:MAG: hypothetical protein CMJ76_13345 [Planctomycetaceae bacterium]|nr:hypothetical protein [Planctomycetaceae bacterium]|tara:strand:- start:3026 stop:4558 length:1533 start_codon:yes stop_codon:yes gene_type:complete
MSDFVKLLLTVLFVLYSGQPCYSEGADVALVVEIDFGEDRGQPFGNLFELVNPAGEVVGGAGFLDVYNTRFRNDRYKVQFYVKPTKHVAPTIARYPVPARHTGLFIFDIDNTVYGWAGNQSTYEWDISKQQWLPSIRYAQKNQPSGYGGMRLSDGHLNFSTAGVFYNDALAIALPKTGRCYNYYYAEGHIFFFHVDQIDNKFTTRIYAVKWKPGDPPVQDIASAVSTTCRYPRTTPFSWGQHKGRVITVGNYGGIYTYVDGKWIEELEGSDKYSYQVYSHMHYNGVSYMAQYPTGNLFAYDRGVPIHIKGWPPKLAEVSASAREAMSMGIYGGDMYVGVWPWAELWRIDAKQRNWNYITRGFTHPKLTNKQVHPYEAEANQQGLVLNHWGQRITSLVPLGSDLYMGTSSKGLDNWTADRDFLPREQADQYGALLKLTLPGTITASVKWSDKPIRLHFHVFPDRIEIRHKQLRLGLSKIDQTTYDSISVAAPRIGTGVFGPTDLKSVRLVD